MPKLTEEQKRALMGLGLTEGCPPLTEAQETPQSGPLHDLLQDYIEKAVKRAKREPEYQAPKPRRITTHSAWEEPDEEEDWSQVEEEYGEAFDKIVAAMCDWDKVFGPAVQAFMDELTQRLRGAVPRDAQGTIPLEGFMEAIGETDIPEALSAGFEKHFKVQVK